MKPNPILEEVWRVKDELSREAGHDIHRLCENTRQWAAQHPYTGSVIRNAEDLRRLVGIKKRQRTATAAMVLNDKPPGQA